MKIVQVHTQAAAGGTQRVSDMVADGLTARGHNVRTVFMYRYSDAYDHAENSDILFQGSTGLSAKFNGAVSLFRYLRRAKPDAVITYDIWGNLLGALGATLAGVPIIVANQSLAPARKGKQAIGSLLDLMFGMTPLYSCNIVNSAWTRAQFDRYPRAYQDKLTFIEHGCWRPSTKLDKASARQRFNLPPDAKLVISVGRLSDVKNQASLIHALDLLPDTHLALAGNGPARQDLLDLAKQYGMTERLHLLGEVPRAEVFDFMAAGDVFAFPSKSETFGLAAVEAAISGTPVVASDLAVLRDVLADHNGAPAAVFADVSDPQALAASLSLVLNDEETRQRLIQVGETLADKYDPARMADAYAALIENHKR